MRTAAQRKAGREFAFTEQEFRFLSKTVYERVGIVLSDRKRDMVYTRLARRLRSLGLQTFAQYCDTLKGPDADSEFGYLINAITTNHTRFFREPHHFHHLRNVVVRRFAKELRTKRAEGLRIWSAGCSTGEEPYSAAMVVAASLARAEAVKVKILATDLDSNVLEACRRARYPLESLDAVPAPLRARFVKQDEQEGVADIDPRLRELIAFKQLNLLHDWPMKGPFDLIFCRNVMIYFDNETRNELIRRYAELLRPGGYFYLGHSESLLEQGHLFELESSSTYRKPG